MSIYLHKILPLFFLPTGLTLSLILAGLILNRRCLIWIGLIFLWLCGTSVVSNLIVRSVEGWSERGLAVNAPSAEAIVVLSGGRVMAPGKDQVSEWGDPDRYYAGVELFKAGKAPLLVFTGGSSPWEPRAQLEGDILSEYAKEMSIPSAAILTTASVVNTAEEAQAVAALLNGRLKKADDSHGMSARSIKIVLVTSAFHMSRAQALFERTGFQVIPFAVDFQVSTGSELGLMSFLPSAGALSKTELAWREGYGRLYYWVRSHYLALSFAR